MFNTTKENLLTRGWIEVDGELFTLDKRYRADVLQDGSIGLMFNDPLSGYVSAGPVIGIEDFPKSCAAIASQVAGAARSLALAA